MSMLNVQIYIKKIRHLLSGVIFRFLPNLRRLKPWSSCAQVHELPQSHCGDNREGTLLS